jgi:beta-lactamase superfamily II metal-dependent hydrolase
MRRRARVCRFVTSSAAAEMTVHFVDVGQGGGVFIQKDGKNIVYDCGDTFATTTMIDYLEAHGRGGCLFSRP